MTLEVNNPFWGYVSVREVAIRNWEHADTEFRMLWMKDYMQFRTCVLKCASLAFRQLAADGGNLRAPRYVHDDAAEREYVDSAVGTGERNDCGIWGFSLLYVQYPRECVSLLAVPVQRVLREKRKEILKTMGL